VQGQLGVGMRVGQCPGASEGGIYEAPVVERDEPVGLV